MTTSLPSWTRACALGFRLTYGVISHTTLHCVNAMTVSFFEFTSKVWIIGVYEIFDLKLDESCAWHPNLHMCLGVFLRMIHSACMSQCSHVHCTCNHCRFWHPLQTTSHRRSCCDAAKTHVTCTCSYFGNCVPTFLLATSVHVKNSSALIGCLFQ